MSGPLRVGLIGCGRIAEKHLRAFEEHPHRLQLVAACDINRDAAEAVGQRFGIDAVFTDYRQLLAEAACDAVDICTIHDQHAEQAIAAAESGRHILLEKPMAVSMQQCQAMVASAQKAGVTFMIAQNQRYMANYRAVKRIIAAGELGPIDVVRIESHGKGLFGRSPGHWVHDGARAGGGVCISLALHRIDLMRFFVGDPARVRAISRCTHPILSNGAEDVAAAILEYESGAVGQFFATFTPFRAPWGESFAIYGRQGTVHVNPATVSYREGAMIASAGRGGVPTGIRDSYTGFSQLEVDRAGLPTGEMYVDELLHFADCCATGREPISSARDNLGTMRILFGIYESARRGGEVVELADLHPL